MIKKGFTLVEMLIYMGLLTIFLAVIGTIFFSIIDLQLESQATSSVSESGRYLLSRISYDVHRAQSITTPASPGLSSPSLVLSIGGVTYTYAEVAGTPAFLQLTAGGLVDALTGSDAQISNFSATRVGNASGKNSLKVSFTLESVTTSLSQKHETKDYSTTITLR